MSTLKFNKWQSIDGVTRNAVLQVVSKEVTTQFTSTSTSFVDVTDMNLAITPTSSTSKILVKFNVHSMAERLASPTYISFQILRNDNVVFAPWVNNTTGNFMFGILVLNAERVTIRGMQPLEFLDDPQTTNELTYKLQTCVYVSSNSGRLYVNETSTSGLQKSVITLMEIAQ
jgi:hypothetical protein